MLEAILEWDRETFIYLNGLGIERYDAFWSAVTNFNHWIPLLALFIFLFFRQFQTKKALAVLGTVLFLALFITTLTDLTKEAVARIRPNNNEEINTLIRIVKSPTDFSFFSGHAASSFSITTLVFLFLRREIRWSWLFYIWPILFAMSRIYVGVHYPIDIIVGALVGIASAVFIHLLYKQLIVPCLGLDHL
ncbi:phosphatase PAP2 family protein [Maribacter algicola]|uniref:Phosphatase PAP2 family protein n=1 Tax=Meishania litoralis TaxID=3434685 RepID=A0ACC7LT30_9FLAO